MVLAMGALGWAGCSDVVAGLPAGQGGTGGSTVERPVAPRDVLDGDVTFSPSSQSFREGLSVALLTALAGVQIRFTTDGKLPTASSSLYDGLPLTLTSTTEVRAQAFVGERGVGLVSTGLYVARSFDLSSHLPILLLDGYGQGLPGDKGDYLDAAVMLWEPVDGVASLTALPTVVARAGYHLHGQSSARFAQKPYKVELRDNADEDASHAVLGMPADADWALIAPYYDRSLIRNPLVYGLGKEMGMLAPRTRNVEVYVNGEPRPIGEDDYQGIYWLTETIKVDKNRFTLAKLKTDDLTLPAIAGGYIFKFDQAATDPSSEVAKLTCTPSADVTCWRDCELVEPHPFNQQQVDWITAYVQAFHETLFATPLGDYAHYIDVSSFVDNLIVNELTRNVDAYTRSSYYHKDRGGLLAGGPLWDYNFSLGVGGADSIVAAPETKGFQFQGRRNVNSWYPRLTTDEAFMAKVKERWKVLRAGVLSQAALEERIARLTAALDAEAIARDYAKWPVDSVLPNGHRGIVYGPSDPSWAGQVEALRDFIVRRAAWMDAQWE